MQAAVIEGPGQLRVRELPCPEPGAYQALCELLFGAVCAGTDMHLVAGHQPFCGWIKTPAVLGHESIGRVLRVGAKVRHLQAEDLVTRVGTTPVGGVEIAWGGFAEFGIATDWRAMEEDGMPAEQWQGVQMQRVLPAGADPAAATMYITWRETLSYLLRMGLKSGQKVLIVGSGGNGLAFARHAVVAGAGAVVTGSAARRGVVETLGAVLVDYQAGNPTEAARAAAPGGYDLIVDAVGKAGGLNAYLPLLKENGIVGIYGLDEAMSCSLNPMAVGKSFRFYNGGYDEAETHEHVVSLVREGRLEARPFLTNFDRPFPLAQIGEALAAVRERRCVKALVRLRG